MSVPTMPGLSNSFIVDAGLPLAKDLYYQNDAEELIAHTLNRGQGTLNDTGALVIRTGTFTGRSPKDKFIVKDSITESSVHWNEFNNPIAPEYFDLLYGKMMNYLDDREVWVRDCFACADPDYRVNIRILNEHPWANLFAYNMFQRPTEEELTDFSAEWNIIHAPGFKADPAVDGTRQANFSIINFSRKTILVGGSAYTGEIKKGLFTVLNFILPHEKNVLSMHCSANVGKNGDTAIFFGLSGTGKTTLSADPNRMLIGDDEHGWANDNVFNIEGGCYAKTIDLDIKKEPEIFAAIRPGALVENVTFKDGGNQIDFSSKKITENSRVSYPLYFISNALNPAIGKSPENIFFLTCDAYGILPPLSKLSTGQAMYHFISGYTAKVAGTESGVTEPKATFSACFGAPFLPLHPGQYAAMLGKKIKAGNVNVWMINTGWSGGPYGIGKRMNLNYTRAMIAAVLESKLDEVAFKNDPVFGLSVPLNCPGVPGEMLNPKNTWEDQVIYDLKAKELAQLFIVNFEKYANGLDAEILAAAPVV